MRTGAWRVAAALGTAAVAVAALATATARADTGVAVDLGRVDIDDTLSPGGRYSLPTIGVHNPGSDPADYRMSVERLDGHESPPPGWVSFSPRTFSLTSGQTQPVEVELRLPPGARPGRYHALLAAQLDGRRDGVSIGAGAAAQLSFEVEPAGAAGAWLRALRGYLAEHSPWSYVAPSLLVALLLGRAARRRFRLEIVRRTT